ncbi:hypothetical protein KC19_10G029400 [Ceratodon purpureus]|uniref:Heterokaryon incompatibility domain-containing protein n=1 Tax=Ceratodon purpureus TaxID=3225 RepID=A0A8T0GJN6_CERPU|nr:hypothetical protein KC19_10G029400 [Ceratodon purpureus]
METEPGSKMLANGFMCRECESRSEDFSKYFRNRAGEASTEAVREWLLASTEPVREWRLDHLKRTARECRFCSLVLKVASIGRTVEDPSAVCSMTVQVLGYIHPDGYCDTDTYEYISRLQFDLKVEGVKQKFSYGDGSQSLYPAYSPGLQLLASDPLSMSEGSMLLGRPIGTTQVDISLIKDHWLSCCEANHPACTPERWFDKAPDLPLRLIDVKRRKVVQAPHNCRYVALSYVWGHLEQVQLKRGTMAKLEEDGGVLIATSKSILDAIVLVDMLGMEYLWVDSLCIIQDDDGDRARQIANMNVVYACAVLTIVSAAGSDANGGLPGVLPGSRSPTQFTESINGLNLITSQCPFSWAVNESVWNTRGWTFQEKVLSKRLLIFTRHQVFYHCNEATWFEDTIFEKNDSSFMVDMVEDASRELCYKFPNTLETPLVHRELCYKFPNMAISLYRYLVTGYRARSLTHESDALNAFAGILQSLSAEFSGGFLWGLPQSALQHGMLWATTNHSPDRRNPCFPSWSWAGWKLGGGFELRQPSPYLDGHLISDWYRVDDRGNHIIIQRVDPGMALFDSGIEGSQQHIRSCGLDLSGDAEMGEFRLDSNHLSHLVRFWTTSTNLLVLPGDPSNGGDGCYLCEVMTMGKKHIGNIRLNQKWHTNRTGSFEFIVISRCGGKWINEKWFTLNVMLIEWRNDIAYRVQLPEEPFQETVWVEANPQWRLITLG